MPFAPDRRDAGGPRPTRACDPNLVDGVERVGGVPGEHIGQARRQSASGGHRHPRRRSIALHREQALDRFVVVVDRRARNA
ncbi:MAG: hypothetical protein M5T61_06460 [Acidimicrobiia bacterium]|nr:hypothetical protein [Acidimicrobiia bacterium]